MQFCSIGTNMGVCVCTRMYDKWCERGEKERRSFLYFIFHKSSVKQNKKSDEDREERKMRKEKRMNEVHKHMSIWLVYTGCMV